MSQNDEVTVRIQVSERLRYLDEVRMPRQEYLALKQRLDNPIGPHEKGMLSERVRRLVNPDWDLHDAYDVEIENFQAQEPAEGTAAAPVGGL